MFRCLSQDTIRVLRAVIGSALYVTLCVSPFPTLCDTLYVPLCVTLCA